MGNISTRGRYIRGGSSSGPNRQFFDQMSSSYSNRSQSYYHTNTPMTSNPIHTDFHYQNNRSQASSASGSRSRFNSNRNSRTDQSSPNGKRLISTTSNSSYEISSTSSGKFDRSMSLVDKISSVMLENRPRLKLLPRSQKLSSSTDDQESLELPTRNLNIFGSGISN